MLTETELHQLPGGGQSGGTKSPGGGFILAIIALVGSLVAIGMSISALSNSNQKTKTAAPAPAAAPAVPAPAAVPAAPAAPAVPTIAVTVHDFALEAAVTTAPAGLINFNVTDNGPTPHEFLIFKADMAPDQMPLGADGRVDESNASISKVFDSGDNIAVGTTKNFQAALVAGKYVLVCNLPGHYKAGMHTAFTVTDPVVPATTVAITEHDFQIDSPVTTAKGGLIDYVVTDNGPTPHEFLIFKADMAPDQLPLGTDGRVDESNASISKVFDSGDNIAVGTTKTMHAALTPGKYVLVCNLPAHYKAGMHTAFTVS